MSSTKITVYGRFSYANVWKPKLNDDGKEKYSISILIDKSDKKQKKKIDAAIQAAIEAGATVLKGKKKGLKLPLRDGDEDREGDGAYENCWFLNANSDQQPGILDEHKNEILDERQFYSGCYGYASINFFAYNRKGNVGVGVGLNHLMKTKAGEPLSGRGSAEDDFADIEVEEDDEEANEFF